MLRYAVAAAKLAEPSTTYASSSFTRYRNGLSPVFSPDAFLPLTRPQIVSTDSPRTFFRTARFISTNSADAGFSSFAAIVAFALTITGSDVPAGGPDAAGSTIAAILVDFVFFASEWVVSSRASAAFSAFAMAGFTFAGLGLAWSAASSASTGSLSAVLSKQTNPLVSEHASMLTCGKGQLQPARTAASAPMNS